MALLGFELLFRFLWGWLIVLSLVSRVETSERYPRIAAGIALGAAAFAAFLLLKSGLTPSEYLSPILGLAAMILGVFFYAFTQSRGPRILGFLLFLLAPASVLYGKSAGELFNFTTAALLLGAAFGGQYLGHWFLTVPGLHIRNLQRIVHLLIAAVILKSLENGLTLYHRYQATLTGGFQVLPQNTSGNLSGVGADHAVRGLQGELWLGLGTFGILILVTRILWGLAAPLVLSFLIKSTVDMRSTQSATGILYALCVMLLVGEGAALYLVRALGIFL